MGEILHIDSITAIHNMLGLKKPQHPLISVIPIDDKLTQFDYGDATYVPGFYQISLKEGICGEVTYGRNTYDFQEGSMVFTKPGQTLSFKADEAEAASGGWVLLFHPDLIRKSPLAQHMDQYSFFSYDTHEALHLSDEEKASLTDLVGKIEREYNQNIDRHSQKLIVANIELILDYCTRYYDRQFYVRTNLNQDLMTKFEKILNEYFESDSTLESGLPTVKYFGEKLNMSPSYMSDLLKKETGRTAQQQIQEKVTERAKNLLLGTQDNISQIAYTLGFEYPQHFSKLFKRQTGLSPAEYRQKHH